MSKRSVTPAIRQLRAHGVEYEVLSYNYQERGGAAHAAESLNVPLHQMLKTIVFEDESGNCLFAVMHGDLEISAKELARHAGVKKLKPADPAKITRITGYKVGGTSPFGSRSKLPVFIEAGALAFEDVYINGGARGVILRIKSSLITGILGAEPVSMAIPAVN